MNKTYKSIWNEPPGTYVATAETAAASGRKTSPGRKARRVPARAHAGQLALEQRIVFDAALPATLVETQSESSAGQSDPLYEDLDQLEADDTAPEPVVASEEQDVDEAAPLPEVEAATAPASGTDETEAAADEADTDTDETATEGEGADVEADDWPMPGRTNPRRPSLQTMGWRPRWARPKWSRRLRPSARRSFLWIRRRGSSRNTWTRTPARSMCSTRIATVLSRSPRFWMAVPASTASTSSATGAMGRFFWGPARWTRTPSRTTTAMKWM